MSQSSKHNFVEAFPNSVFKMLRPLCLNLSLVFTCNGILIARYNSSKCLSIKSVCLTQKDVDVVVVVVAVAVAVGSSSLGHVKDKCEMGKGKWCQAHVVIFHTAHQGCNRNKAQTHIRAETHVTVNYATQIRLRRRNVT